MPNAYQPMGGVPDFYSQILGDAQANLVRLPDGSYAPAPRFGGPTSLDQIYGGVLPSAPQVPRTLATRSVNTLPIDRDGNPIVGSSSGPGFTAPTMAATRTEQTGARRVDTQGVQPAGTLPLPPGVTPQSVLQAFAQMGGQAPTGPMGRGRPTMVAQGAPPPLPNAPGYDPFGTYNPNADQSRLPRGVANPGEDEFMAAFYPQAQNPAVAGINGALNVPMPRMRPLPPARIPLTSVPRPDVPSPSYTIKSGDTLSALAKRFGTTVGALANANGISDPNRIRAGGTLNLGYLAPPVPRTPSPTVRTPPPVGGGTTFTSGGQTVKQVFNPATNRWENRPV